MCCSYCFFVLLAQARCWDPSEEAGGKGVGSAYPSCSAHSLCEIRVCKPFRWIWFYFLTTAWCDHHELSDWAFHHLSQVLHPVAAGWELWGPDPSTSSLTHSEGTPSLGNAPRNVHIPSANHWHSQLEKPHRKLVILQPRWTLSLWAVMGSVLNVINTVFCIVSIASPI